MEGVKSQAGHIRGTVTQLEEERDRAISGIQAATKELEVCFQQKGWEHAHYVPHRFSEQSSLALLKRTSI